MKLLKITLYNLASFEGEQVIDLESEPLKSADLFSIVGETGSGKSTILDAVCLALYGVAPRFYGADNFNYYNKEKRPDKNKVLEPDDPRNILRKGTKECRAEVSFLARDGYRYRACWSCSVSRVNYTRPNRRLYRLAPNKEGILCEKEIELTVTGAYKKGHKNVNNEVLDAIIGLDYGQFTRTVMLAQNSFANFVKADDKDKAILLEKLTGTEIYTSIAHKIYDFFKQAELSYTELYNEVKAFAVHQLDEEKLEEVTLRLQNLEKEIKQEREKIASLDEAKKWYDALEQLRGVMLEADGKLKLVSAEQEVLAAKRKELLRMDEVAEVRDDFNKMISLNQEVGDLKTRQEQQKKLLQEQQEMEAKSNALLEEQKRSWEELRKMFETFSPKLKEARRLETEIKTGMEQLSRMAKEVGTRKERSAGIEKEMTAIRKEADRLAVVKEQTEAFLQQMEPHRPMLDRAGALVEQLLRLQHLSVQVEEEEQVCARWIKEAGRQQKEIAEKQRSLSADEKELGQLKNEIGLVEQQLQVMDIDRIQTQLEQTALCYKEWEQVGNLYQAIADLWQTEAQMVDELKKDEKALMSVEKETVTCQNELAEIQRVLPGMEESYQLMTGSTVTALRESLQLEQPCPVCGAVHHPYADGIERVLSPMKKKLEEKRERQEVLKKRLEDVTDGLQLQLAELKGKVTALKNGREQLETRKITLAADWLQKANKLAVLPATLDALKKQGVDTDWKVFISAEMEKVIARGKQLRTAQNEYKKMQTLLSDSRSKYDARTVVLQKGTEELHTLTVEWKQLTGGVEQKGKELEKLKGEKVRLGEELALQLSFPELAGLLHENVTMCMERLKELALNYQSAVSKQTELVATLNERNVLVQSLKKQQGELIEEIQTQQLQMSSQQEACGKLQDEYATLLDGQTADEAEQQWKGRLESKERQVSDAEKRHLVIADEYSRLSGSVRTSEELLTGKMDALKVASELVEHFMATYNASHPTMEEPLSRAVLQRYFASLPYWNEIREQIRKVDEEVKMCQGAVQAHRRTLDAHLAKGKEQHMAVWNEGEEDPRLLLLQQMEQLQQQIAEQDEARQLDGGLLAAHRKSMEQMQQCAEELNRRKVAYDNWKELNDILGNVNGDKFRETAQCFTLHFLIRQANEQLRMLNRRYSLEQVPDSLGIRVIDHDRADEMRNISSLSGGETFLISLALALGLSSLSSRSIPMANLFVDEGFGTLDSSSLNLVIDALSNLQSMQGKKVGVISHTSEMKERIRTQIQVIKVGSGGRSMLQVK